jgi:hypothetical protein
MRERTKSKIKIKAAMPVPIESEQEVALSMSTVVAQRPAVSKQLASHDFCSSPIVL